MWHSVASDNLGVGALTVSHVQIVEEIAARLNRPVRFVVLGWREEREGYVVGSNITAGTLRTRDLLNPFAFLQVVRGCDVVLDIGAGDSFSDIYGTKRFLRYMLAKATVHAAHRPLIVSPQTIGPFKHVWACRLALASLRRSSAVFTRDQLSIDYLRSAGYSGDVALASDVALRLPYTPPAHQSGSPPVRVGVNVSGLLMNGGYSKSNMFGLKVDYADLMRRLVRNFAARPEVEVHLIAHVISDTFPVEDDLTACASLRSELQGSLTAKVVLAPRFDGPSDAKTYIAGMDFFIGARMHACIAAFSSGVPVVPMAYSRKFAGLFGALGYPYTVDCASENADSIEARIMESFAQREKLKSDLGVALSRGRARLGLYEEELERRLEHSARTALT